MDPTTVSLPRTVLTRFFKYAFIVAFVVPLAFNANQIITGTLVNCILFITALRLSRKDAVTISILPSLGAAVHGVLFGPQTVYLLYFLPFIWIGNYVLIAVFKKFTAKRFIPGIITASGIKYILLYIPAYTFESLHIVPKLYVTAMGIVQLGTALMGGFVAYFILKYMNRYDGC